MIRLLIASMSLISVAKSLGAFAKNAAKGACLWVSSALSTWSDRLVIRLDDIFHTFR